MKKIKKIILSRVYLLQNIFFIVTRDSALVAIKNAMHRKFNQVPGILSKLYTWSSNLIVSCELKFSNA